MVWWETPIRTAWIPDTLTNTVIERTWPAGTGQLSAIGGLDRPTHRCSL